ncbi:hypothetical protein CYMTET_34394, partial [Cymbomonas tetramitiformis]
VPCEDNGETFVAPIIDFERPGVKKRKAKVQAAATLYIQKKKLKTAQAPGGVTGGDPGVQSSHTVALPIMAATTDHEVRCTTTCARHLEVSRVVILVFKAVTSSPNQT